MAIPNITQSLTVPANTGGDTLEFENGMRQLYTDIGTWAGQANNTAQGIDDAASAIAGYDTSAKTYRNEAQAARNQAQSAKSDAETAASLAQNASAANAPVWAPSTSYNKNMVVWNDNTSGILCRCIQAHTGRTTEPVQDTTYWAVIGREIVNLRPQFKGVLETRVALTGNNIDLALGNLFTKAITGSTSFTVSNVPALGAVACFVLELTGAAGNTLSFWSGVQGAGNFNYSSGKDIFVFYTYNGGAAWIGLQVAEDI